MTDQVPERKHFHSYCPGKVLWYNPGMEAARRVSDEIILQSGKRTGGSRHGKEKKKKKRSRSCPKEQSAVLDLK